MPPKANKKAKSAIKRARKPKTPSPPLPAELLNMIFEPLCFLDLLRCRQVCKSWNNYLRDGDHKAHEKLFLWTDRWYPVEVTVGVEISIYGSIIRDVPAELPSLRYYLAIEERYDHRLCSWGFHPILDELHRHFDIVYEHASDRTPNYQRLPFSSFKDLWSKIGGRQVAGKYDGGSWEDMLVCVPAAKEVQLVFIWNDPSPVHDEGYDYYDYCRSDVDLRNEDGVRMKDLIQQLRIHLHRALLRAPMFARRTHIEGETTLDEGWVRHQQDLAQIGDRREKYLSRLRRIGMHGTRERHS